MKNLLQKLESMKRSALKRSDFGVATGISNSIDVAITHEMKLLEDIKKELKDLCCCTTLEQDCGRECDNCADFTVDYSSINDLIETFKETERL